MQAKRFQKILLAIDGSEHSKKATDYAVMLAKLCEAEIMLVHSRRRIPDFIGEPYYQRMLDRIQQKTREMFQPFCETLDGAGVKYEEIILDGDPANDIGTVATVESCDLIVMGARGLSDFQGILMGSVSHKVLQTTSCPVLTVR